MFKTLKEFFESRLRETERDKEAGPHTTELAAAVLMLEIGLADSSFDEIERKVMTETMKNSFHLQDDEIETIITLAEKEVDHAVSLHDYTRTINRNLAPEEKVRIVELLWKVAFADAVLDKYEEYFVRKIADLLHVSHRDYIRAKHRANV